MAEQSVAQQSIITRERHFVWLVIAGCFLVSGFAALLYQTIWMRQFGIVFGTSEMAIVATLASYMAGLGSGAYFAQKFLERVKRPIMTYAVLEAGIGVCALAVPYLIAGSGTLLSSLVSLGLIDTYEPAVGVVLAYFLVTFLLLMLPTFMMGATLPILLQFAVRTDAEVGQRTSALYALNTIGAVGGVITTAFVFLPNMDLSQIINIGVGLNFLAAACAALLREPVRSQLPNTLTCPPDSTLPRPLILMVIMALSGVVSFCLEVTWTRLLGHVAGGSVYAFAVMLATFLSGIALGSMLASRFAHRQEQALTALGWVQIGIAVCSTLTYVFIGRLLPEERSWSAILTMSGSVMLPATLLIGATFPLAVRAAVYRPEDTAFIAGRIYAANTVGAIMGAVLTGFILLPLLGFTLTVKSASTLSLILAGVIFFIGEARKPSFTLLPIILIVILLLVPIQRPLVLLHASNLHGNHTEGQELFYAVGRSTTVLAKEHNGYINLRTNGLPEASVAKAGSPPTRNSQQWLGALPYLANPDANSFLVVGLGGGVALEGIPTAPDIRVTIAELESEVLSANERFEPIRRIPVLERPNIKIVINDARSTLSLSSQHYDAIISQPSHPWTAGASHLYTHEFVQLAKSRLNEGGIFLQWINSEFLDEELLRSLAATLLDQFAFVSLFQPAPGVLEFVASDTDLSEVWKLNQVEATLREYKDHFSDIGIQSALDVIAALVLNTQGVEALASNAPLNTDGRNRLATSSRERGNGLNVNEVTALLASIDTFCSASAGLQNTLDTDDSFYIHRQWQLSGFASRSANCLNFAQPPLKALAAAHALLIHQDTNLAAQALTTGSQYADSAQSAHYLLSKLFLLGIAPAQGRISIDLPDAAEATLAAWSAAQKGNWDEVRLLDQRLARSSSSDIWFHDAAKLMSEWRIRNAIANGDDRDLRTALAVIDSALATQWTEDFLLLRAGVATLLRDVKTYLATTENYLILVQKRLDDNRKTGAAKEALGGVTEKRLNGIAIQLSEYWLQMYDAETQLIRERLQEIEMKHGPHQD